SLFSNTDYEINGYSKDGSAVTNVCDEGSYQATIVANGSNCTGSTMITFEVKKVSLADCAITVKSSAVYTGQEQKPEVAVTYGNTTLVEGTDYSVTYDDTADWTNAGSDKKITIAGKNVSYTGEVEKYFEITKKALSASDIEVHYVLGSKGDVSVSITDGSKELTEGTDYTVTSAGVYTEATGGVDITTNLSSYISSVDQLYYYIIEASGDNYTINATVSFTAEYKNQAAVDNGHNDISIDSVSDPGSIFAIEGTSITPYYRGGLTVSLTEGYKSSYYISVTLAVLKG
ncbi:MAG: hypothetical protein LIO96_09340, partial [Lachnospiraceae bacterium]|nr:hypothetical protein [Lachnospiraceae bacterium]